VNFYKYLLMAITLILAGMVLGMSFSLWLFNKFRIEKKLDRIIHYWGLDKE